MLKTQTLRALVTERLTAAAEDILALFERTMGEYEEELRRSKEDIHRTQQQQQRLEESHRAVLPSPSPPPGSGLNQDLTETPIKEEPAGQDVKQEEEPQPVSVPEPTVVCVNKREPSLFQQRQNEEHREEAHREDVSSETEGHTKHFLDTDYTDEWESSISYAVAQLETETEGGHYEVQARDTFVPETSTLLHSRDISLTVHGAQRTKHQCLDCPKHFWTKQDLQRHSKVHTGDRPYSCPICQKTFALKGALNVHRRRHTDKPCSCPICNKEFTNSCNLKRHIRTHTGEKPYCCSFCSKQFNQSSNLKRHMRIHMDEKPELTAHWPREAIGVQVPFF